MCSSPKTPKAPPPPPPPPAAPQQEDIAVVEARERERRRIASSGRDSTMLTGATGVMGVAPTVNKTLLGV